jgi:predicted metal-dependent HD superfamily phosphohydrolase
MSVDPDPILPGSDPAARERARIRWRAAVGAVGGDIERGEAALAGLERRYAESHRAYHTGAHVAALLDLAEPELGRWALPHAVTFAIWYHDAIYRTRRGDNEIESARLAARELAALGVDPTVPPVVTRLIEATAGHEPPDGIADGPRFLDLDLSILGAEPAVYAAYRAAIRREYRWVPEPIYRRRRAEILAGFLARERIYLTAELHDRLEAPARVNLAAELAALEER